MTVVGRQTAYRMRHCCARRIVETGSRRELLQTSTRWAERHPQGVCRIRKASEPPTAAQQRIIGAETSRIAKSLAASVSDAATQAVDSASVAALRAAGLQWRGQGQGPLRSLGGPRGIFSHVREYPPFLVQRLRRCFPPPRNTRKNIKKSTLTGALFQIAEN